MGALVFLSILSAISVDLGTTQEVTIDGVTQTVSTPVDLGEVIADTLNNDLDLQLGIMARLDPINQFWEQDYSDFLSIALGIGPYDIGLAIGGIALNLQNTIIVPKADSSRRVCACNELADYLCRTQNQL